MDDDVNHQKLEKIDIECNNSKDNEKGFCRSIWFRCEEMIKHIKSAEEYKSHFCSIEG